MTSPHFLLLRGLIRESRHWGEFLDVLKTEFEGAQITTIDIPGCGKKNKLASPITIPQTVDHLMAETKYITNSPILISISLGGMLALEWIRRDPDFFRAAVLMNTSVGGVSAVHERLKPTALLHLLKTVPAKGRVREKLILDLVMNESKRLEANLDLCERLNNDNPVSLVNSLRQLIAAGTFKLDPFHPKVPLLFLASENDRMVSSKCSKTLANKFNSECVLHPSAGHDLAADDPKWVVLQIKSLLAKS